MDELIYHFSNILNIIFQMMLVGAYIESIITNKKVKYGYKYPKRTPMFRKFPPYYIFWLLRQYLIMWLVLLWWKITRNQLQTARSQEQVYWGVPRKIFFCLFVYNFKMLFNLIYRDYLTKMPQNTGVTPSHTEEKKGWHCFIIIGGKINFNIG